MNNTCNACGHRQADEYSFCEECGFDTLSANAETRTEVGAAASGKAVAWRNWIGEKWAYFDADPREVHDNGKPVEALYTHPATVTNEVSPPLNVSDEDVERAQLEIIGLKGHCATMVPKDEMRAALESFVRPTPPTSTKQLAASAALERV